MKIALNLEKLLAERERSLLSVANETGLNYNTLHRLMSGKAQGITYSTIGLLCDALQCNPGDLFTEEEAMPKKKKRGAK